MAKEFNEIMQDMKEWQEEQNDRVVICFVACKEQGLYDALAGNGVDIASAMAFYAFQDKDIMELMEAALMAAKTMQKEKENEE